MHVNFTNVLCDGQIAHKACKLPKLKVKHWGMNLKNNELMVIDMLVDYLIGDLVFVANENNILQC